MQAAEWTSFSAQCAKLSTRQRGALIVLLDGGAQAKAKSAVALIEQVAQQHLHFPACQSTRAAWPGKQLAALSLCAMRAHFQCPVGYAAGPSAP